MISLPEKFKVISEEGNVGVFEISPLYPGYGMTIGNSIRRVLLSSLPGAAITSIKIKGVDHEFSAMEGVQEDVLEIIRNLKSVRFKVFSDEPVKLTISKNSEGVVTAKDIKLTSDVELSNPDQVIATVTAKGTKFEVELEVENGIGFLPVEMRQKDKLAVGVIAIDAVFNPVKRSNYEIENIRIGQRTDYNKVVLTVETDGTMTPQDALLQSVNLLLDHLNTILGNKEATPVVDAIEEAEETKEE